MQMQRQIVIGLGCFTIALVVTTAPGGEAPKRPGVAEQSFKETVQPFLKQYCSECHGGEDPEAGVALDGSWDTAGVRKDRETWVQVLEMLEEREMPPKFVRQPTDDQRAAVLDWLEATLGDADASPHPGHVTLRRLNRAQYGNTIRDLLGVEFDATDDFPADDVGYGFDNIGDVLSLPPILMEKYMAAAEEIADRAIVVDPLRASPSRRLEANQLKGGSRRGDHRMLASQGEIHGTFDIPSDTIYVIRVTAYGDQAGDEPAKAELAIDGEKREVFEVTAAAGAPQVYESYETLRAGKRRVGVAFINDYYNPTAADPAQRDRNLAVAAVEVVGPLIQNREGYPESHRRIFFVQPEKRENDPRSWEEATPKILRRLASRAFRRPATEAEVQRLAKLAAIAREEGDSDQAGIRLALEAILCSPHFLFMVERDPADDEDLRRLNEYELATRISYFLWSSMPDDELFEYAGRGMLRANLEAQVRRMLKDGKSRALVDQFAQQWFQLRNLEMVTPDKKQFGTFDDELRRDMATETLMFFAAVLSEDRSLLNLIDGDFTFLNGRLARHYGIPGVEGDTFRRVSLAGTPRGGVLTQASVLTVTSNPTRTSPVKRGKWIMENILGTPPPDPPADVPMLDEQTVLTGSLRQRMEQHRKDPQCSVCHQTMDPLGFAMENFDAVGRWRTKDGEYEIDASGVLPDGKSFNGPAELREILLAIGREDFAQCVTEKMLTYALGRGVERSDAQYVGEITQALSEGEYRLSSLILAIIRSDPFQKRSGKRGES